MKLSFIFDKWKALVVSLNAKGVPVPMIRDPKTGQSSVSLTLVFVSFNAVLIGIVGKWSKALGDIDIAQALNLFYACAALYFGRNMSTDGKGKNQLGENLQAPAVPPKDPGAQQ